MGETSRVAVPLSQVARLEEVESATIEQAQGQEVVQYRGTILPLIRLAHVLNVEADAEAELLQVVVYSERERSVGLVVDHILDIVEEELNIQQRASRLGMLGSAIVQDRVADVLDVRSIVQMVDPHFFESMGVEEAA